MFKPILITTPRTGSSVICHYLAQIAKQTANYQNNLTEYFDKAPWNNLHYRVFKHFGKNIIGLCTDERILRLNNYDGDINKNLISKFELIKNNEYNYMIKLIPYDYDNTILDWCMSNYKPIYLERKNKLAQLFSFMAMLTTKTSHYDESSTSSISKINFNLKFLNIFDKIQTQYSFYKTKYPGPVLVYEDLFDKEFTVDILIKRLNIDNVDLALIEKHITRKTLYESYDWDILVENKQEYKNNKMLVDTMLEKWK